MFAQHTYAVYLSDILVQQNLCVLLVCDILLHTCAPSLHNILIRHTGMAYLHCIFARHTGTTYFLAILGWYTAMIYLHDILDWHTCVAYQHHILVQPICTLCIFDILARRTKPALSSRSLQPSGCCIVGITSSWSVLLSSQSSFLSVTFSTVNYSWCHWQCCVCGAWSSHCKVFCSLMSFIIRLLVERDVPCCDMCAPSGSPSGSPDGGGGDDMASLFSYALHNLPFWASV